MYLLILNLTLIFNQQINLECLKDKYSDSVKKILDKNYKNFEDLVKNNSRFEKFISQYSNEKLLSKNMVKDINIKMPSYHDEFYHKCDSMLAEMKGFFDYISTK